MKNKDLSFYILFVSIAIVFSTLESIIPKPFVFIKIGFANIITLFVLYKYGIKKSFLILLFRIIFVALILGTLFTPSFILSFIGGISGYTIMILCYVFFKNHISALGLSVAGSFVNNSAQLLTAYIFFGFSKQIFNFFPYLTFLSLITGSIVGYLANYLIKKVQIPKKNNLKS